MLAILSTNSDAAEPAPLLFVYGSMMRGLERSSYLQNTDRARFIGEAVASGKLYEFGSLPCLIPDPLGFRVKGELYELYDPESSLATLDLIEGCWPAESERGLYVRQLIHVRRHDAGEFEAWAYMFNFPPDDLTEIVSGDYRQLCLTRS